MSSWTYVFGVIEVDTLANSTAQAMYVAQTVVNHLPKISGSEMDARWRVFMSDGFSASSNVDEFNQPSNLYTDRYKMFDIQTCAIINLDGSLRDREFQQTLSETTKALARLGSRVWVKQCLISVKDDRGNSFVFDSPDWLVDMEISDWTDRLFKK